MKIKQVLNARESENEKAVMKAYDFLMSKDIDSLTNMFTDDFKWVGASSTEWNKEEFHRLQIRDANVFQDFKVNIQRIIAKENTVVTEYLWIAIHAGEIYGLPATNKKIAVPFVEIFDFEDGKIKLWKTYCNMELYKKQMTE